LHCCDVRGYAPCIWWFNQSIKVRMLSQARHLPPELVLYSVPACSATSPPDGGNV